MQKLLHDIKQDMSYRKSLSQMRVLDVQDFVSKENTDVGHSPYAFEKIALWLKYQCGMSVGDVVEYLSNFKDKSGKLKKVHKNSWFRWSSPSLATQSNNIYYDTWLPLRSATNALLARHGRDVDDFTQEPTYTPRNFVRLRVALGLDYNGFAKITGLTNGRIVRKMEIEDPSINRRGAGFDDCAGNHQTG